MSVFKKKKSTIGYKYYLGMHIVLCHGKLDSLNDIFVDGNKKIWTGRVTKSETIEIDKPEILGGNSSEGGISGELDVLWGSDIEPVNQYLQDNIGAVPNFRGVCSVVLKQMYLGNNSYIKRWSFKATRTKTFDNWYPQKGSIGEETPPDYLSGGGKVVMIVDASYSMAQGFSQTKAFTDRCFNFIRSLVEAGADYEFATYTVADFGRAMQPYTIKLLDGTQVVVNLPLDGRQNPNLHIVDWEDPETWYTFQYGFSTFRFAKPEFIYDSSSATYVYQGLYLEAKYNLASLSYIPEPVQSLGPSFWSYPTKSINDTQYHYTSWSEVPNYYIGHGLDPSKMRINLGTWTSMVNESFMVSPNVVSSFLELEKPENKVVLIFSDINSNSGLRIEGSMFMPQDRASDITWRSSASTLRDASIPINDTFYRGLFESAGHFRKFGQLTKDVCSYEKRNLIKCMNIVVSEESDQQRFPWITPPLPDIGLWTAPFSMQSMGTMPPDYFGGNVPVLVPSSGANADTLFENFKKLLRWEYDSEDPHGDVSDGTYNADMGPAHIIRECLTNPIWGMGYPASDIDDSSFKHAADVFWDEKLGLSLLLEKETTVEEFIKEVLRHVDAVLYIDRRTGLFCLKPVRDDYSVESLLVLDESNIISMSDYSKPTLGELTNSVTVNAWDKKTNTTLSVTAQNAALAMVQGREISTKIQYPGITNRENAARLAQRDLRTYSTPLIRCTLEVDDAAEGLTIGGVFAFSWSDYGIDKLPMRIVGIDYGTDRKHSIRISCIQDIFSTPTNIIVRPVDPIWENPTQVSPSIISNAIAIESPYYELCAQIGQTQVDANLSTNPEIGFGLIAAQKPPNAAYGYVFKRDSYGTDTEVGNLSFAPFAQVYEAIKPTANPYLLEYAIIVTIADSDFLKLRPEQWLLINNEILSVDQFPAVGIGYKVGDNEFLIYVKRGCFDTIPSEHLPGSLVYFMSDANLLDLTEMAMGETQNYLMHSINSASQSNNSQTAVTFNQRAIRPYPPGDVTINGKYFNVDILTTIQLRWKHRNRKLQTGGKIIGFDGDGFSEPEQGTTYKLELINKENNTVIYSIDGLTSFEFEIPPTNIPFELDNVNLRLSSIRDGYVCWQPYEQRIFLSAPIGGNLEFNVDSKGTPPNGGNLEFNLT